MVVSALESLNQNGLESPYPGVVAYSVQGLCRLRVRSAIPRISDAVSRIPLGDRAAVAAQLPWYASRLFLKDAFSYGRIFGDLYGRIASDP